MRLMRQLFGNNVPILKDRDMVEAWLYQTIAYETSNYTVNDDLSVDVDGHVHLTMKMIGSISFLPVRFRYVTKTFVIGPAKLTTLKGCPIEVGESFFVRGNRITTLQFGPREVGGAYMCESNSLTTLRGAPREIPGAFGCSSNYLTSLEGGPVRVEGDYICTRNNLKSTTGIAKYIGGSLHLYENATKITDRTLPNTHVEGEIWWDVPS